MSEMNEFLKLMQQHLDLKQRLEEVTRVVKPFSQLRIVGNNLNRHLVSCRSQNGYLEQHLQAFEHLEEKLQTLAKENAAMAVHLLKRPPGFEKAHREARGVIARFEQIEVTIETRMRERSEALRTRKDPTMTDQQQLESAQVQNCKEKLESACEKELPFEFGSTKQSDSKASVMEIQISVQNVKPSEREQVVDSAQQESDAVDSVKDEHQFVNDFPQENTKNFVSQLSLCLGRIDPREFEIMLYNLSHFYCPHPKKGRNDLGLDYICGVTLKDLGFAIFSSNIYKHLIRSEPSRPTTKENEKINSYTFKTLLGNASIRNLSTRDGHVLADILDKLSKKAQLNKRENTDHATENISACKENEQVEDSSDVSLELEQILLRSVAHALDLVRVIVGLYNMKLFDADLLFQCIGCLFPVTAHKYRPSDIVNELSLQCLFKLLSTTGKRLSEQRFHVTLLGIVVTHLESIHKDGSISIEKQETIDKILRLSNNKWVCSDLQKGNQNRLEPNETLISPAILEMKSNENSTRISSTDSTTDTEWNLLLEEINILNNQNQSVIDTKHETTPKRSLFKLARSFIGGTLKRMHLVPLKSHESKLTASNKSSGVHRLSKSDEGPLAKNKLEKAKVFSSLSKLPWT